MEITTKHYYYCIIFVCQKVINRQINQCVMMFEVNYTLEQTILNGLIWHLGGVLVLKCTVNAFLSGADI